MFAFWIYNTKEKVHSVCLRCLSAKLLLHVLRFVLKFLIFYA